MRYKLVPVEPTREMWAAAGNAVVALNSQHHDAVSEAVYKAMLAAAPEMEQEPYAYEYGASNGDGTFSVVMDKGRLSQLGETEYDYCHPGIFASKERPVTPLYLHPQPAPEVAKLVEALDEMIEVAKAVDSWESFPSAPIERAEDAIRAYRNQGGDL